MRDNSNRAPIVFFCLSVVPVLAIFALNSVANINDQPPTTADIVVAADTTQEGIWKRECSSCHGKDGIGKTRAGRRAKVKDFTDKEYQSTWTDEEAVEVISTATKNGEELKNKKPYAEKLTVEEITLMVAFVREFAK
jgi:mono/diheme cytochrome c family protein